MFVSETETAHKEVDDVFSAPHPLLATRETIRQSFVAEKTLFSRLCVRKKRPFIRRRRRGPLLGHESKERSKKECKKSASRVLAHIWCSDRVTDGSWVATRMRSRRRGLSLCLAPHNGSHAETKVAASDPPVPLIIDTHCDSHFRVL